MSVANVIDLSPDYWRPVARPVAPRPPLALLIFALVLAVAGLAIDAAAGAPVGPVALPLASVALSLALGLLLTEVRYAVTR